MKAQKPVVKIGTNLKETGLIVTAINRDSVTIKAPHGRSQNWKFSKVEAFLREVN